MAATLTDPMLGRIVDGRYEVLARIARGGMATVYLARDRRLDREVALKVMHAHLAEGGSGAEFVARFRREAKAAARLTHPGLVGVFDQGVDGETSYLTMEYVDGTNLRRHLGEQGALSVGDALRTAEAVLDALTAAHRVDLVHRDVKPENVLLSSDGRIKVADFGLARAITEVTSTTTGTILGTVAYLAPELVAHGTSDTRTDVYSVGILLYEMLTGRQPFTGATPIQVAYQHVHSDVPAPSDRVAWLPVEIDELVGALAARDPQDRPADARAALDLVRRTLATLDAATLDRSADVAPSVVLPAATEGTPGGDDDAEHDPDATQALSDPDRRRDGADRPDDDAGRTVALRIGAGLHPEEPPASPARRSRRRLVLAALVLAVLAGLAGLGWWWTTQGPGAWTTVPTGLVGLEATEAEQVLASAGLEDDATEVFDPVVPAGSVVAVEPAEGERVRTDGTVTLSVSQGPQMTTMPADLPGKPLADVVAALEAAGLVPAEPTREHSDVVAAELVLGLGVEPGASVPVGTEVPLVVSDGPEPVRIISVVGAEAGLAKQQLESQGLRVTEAQDYSEQYAAGVVMAQSPEANTMGKRTDTVTITVSQGPPLVAVPNVVGKQYEEAEQLLEAAGFRVDRENVLGGYFGTVRDQSVAPDQPTPKGTTITLTVV